MAAAIGSTIHLVDGPSDLVNAAAVVGLAVMLSTMVMADMLKKVGARTRL